MARGRRGRGRRLKTVGAADSASAAPNSTVASAHFFWRCLLWQPWHDAPKVPSALVIAATSFFPTASSTDFTLVRYLSVCSFQLFSSPIGGLFLPMSPAAASQALLFSAAESQSHSLSLANLPSAPRAEF